jgi:hypothetical protein
VFYSFGVANPGAITVHNFPNFLRKLRRPDGEIVDLASIDVMRDRERGVPRYNRFRRLLGVRPIRSFDDLANPLHPSLPEELRRIYGQTGGKDNVERLDLMVGLFSEVPPDGFGFSDTAFRIFILMASRRLNSDRFFTTDYTPAVYTQAGMDWINDNSMATVLLRHYPQLRPAIGALPNAFAPWDRAVPGSTRPAGAAGRVGARNPSSLVGLTMSQLGELFRSAKPGPIPHGHGRGTVLLGTGGPLARLAAVVSYELLWRGKVVNARKGRLKNLLSALAIPAIAAAVYEQNSWFDGKPCIVLDYSKTSIVAHLVRDEIREIAPGVYLGLVFLGRRHVLDFTLDFNREQ